MLGLHRRSLQRELLSILEAAVGFDVARQGGSPQAVPQDSLTIEELGELSRQLFPNGTASSVEYLRQLRRSR